MPPHLALWNLDGTAFETLDVSLSGGEESDVISLEIINDKNAIQIETTTASGILAVLLAAIAGGPWKSAGVMLLDELWCSAAIVKFLDDGVESDDHVTGTQPLGTNSTLTLPDLEPQQGVRIELRFTAPGGRGVSSTRVTLGFEGGLASAALSQHVALAHGNSVIPPDRVPGLRALISGSAITADDSDTVTVGHGQQVYDSVITALPEEEIAFDLDDAASVALLAGEFYRVTLSRDSAGEITVTKGAKNDALAYPSSPADEIFVDSFSVESDDGATVTIAQSSVRGLTAYAAMRVRAGGGLNVIVSLGTSVTANDRRQFLTHEVQVGVAASTTNRVWTAFDGSVMVNASDVAPVIGAALLAYAVTDAGAVTSVVDARVFAHRAVVEWPVEMVYRDALSQVATPAHGLAAAQLHFDGELESVSFSVTAADGTWTSGALLADVRWFAPGAEIPFPAGGLGTGGASIYTDDSQRPSIAFDPANLLTTSDRHITRRFARGTWFLFGLLGTVAAPGAEPEQEVRVTLHFRRYR